MRKVGLLMRVAAVVELGYGLAGILVPPDRIDDVLGWQLSPDGQWLAKLLGCALLAQAAVAWSLRDGAPLTIVRILGLYQLGAVAIDAGMWLYMSDDGIFSTSLAQTTVVAAVVSHAVLGVLMLLAAHTAAGSGEPQPTNPTVEAAP